MLIRTVTVTILLLLTLSETAFAGPKQEILTALKNREAMIKDILGPEEQEYTDEQREELRVVINEMMDYGEMARFALDDMFHDLEPAEQEEFTRLFSRIISNQSVKDPGIYRAEVIYEEISVNDDRALVTTTIILNNRRIPVLYRMIHEQDKWFIADMSVDHAWTAESYRRSFQNIIRRRGYEALVESLRRRVEEG